MDPIEHRRAAKAEIAVAHGGITFAEVAERYIAAHESSWRNPKHRAQWRSTLDAYAFPVFGKRPVAEVDTGLVMRVIEPIWQAKTETASRLRGRIESILDFATARGWRSGDNPARWRGHLANLLPARARVQRVEHHAALPWSEVGGFMVQLREQDGIAASALELTILTAARSGEVLNARWSEFDLSAGIWTVPAERMKAHREHRVPLSDRALELLRTLLPLGNTRAGDRVLPGGKAGRPLSNMAMTAVLRRMDRGDLTVHGFRSTFRDWVAETTSYPREVAEAALAHALADKVEAAYRRGDLFEKRRRLTSDWAVFCARPVAAGGNVRALRGGAA